MHSDFPLSGRALPQGVFNVDASGQATYRLVLPTPASLTGMRPGLELVYSHRQPNGALGVGWSIGGLSSITRTKATYAVDGFNGSVNYDARDRLALDGQRLISVDGDYGQPGTLYHTQMHEWKQIRAGGTVEDGFITVMMDGEIWTYGASADSRIKAHGGAQVRVWALHSVEDLHGNRVEYHYTTTPVEGAADCGQYYLDRISYRASDEAAPGSIITFTYEERPDPITAFAAGCGVATLYRLAQINTWLDASTLVHSYDLDYGCSAATRQSRLCSVTERSSSDGARRFEQLITIDWQDTPAPGFDAAALVTLGRHAQTTGFLPMDVSGNGCTDLVQLWIDGRGRLNATTWLADGNGAYDCGAICPLGVFPNEHRILAADLDGDGRADLLVAYRDPHNGNLVLASFASNGASFDALAVHDTGDAWSEHHLGFFVMDVNGDGRLDLVEAYGHADPRRGQLLYFRSYLSLPGAAGTAVFSQALVSATDDPAQPARQLALWPMDVNGDGMVDLVRAWADEQGRTHLTAYLSVSSAVDRVHFTARRDTVLATIDLASHLAFLPLDVNGDGMMDLVQAWQEQTEDGPLLHLRTFFADGAGGFVAGPDSSFHGQGFAPGQFHPIGFTGGGQTQLLNAWRAGDGELMFTVYAASATGLFRRHSENGAGMMGDAGLVLVGDVNGDGKGDLVRIAPDGDGVPVVHTYLSRGPYPDLVSRVSDQLGGVTDIDYAPLSDPGVYRVQQPHSYPESAARRYPNALSPAQFPVEAVLGQAVYVVAQYTQRSGTEPHNRTHTQQFSFTYSDARVDDLLDRGWLGFAEMTMLIP
nr:FG-GAP-like repeat-containing protein [Massilia solisilvae]